MSNPGGPGYSPFATQLFQTARTVVSPFRSPAMQAMLAPWVMHLGRTPDEVGSGLWVPLLVMALLGGGMALPEGGSEKLAQALARLITDHGGVIRTGARATRIRVEHEDVAVDRVRDQSVAGQPERRRDALLLCPRDRDGGRDEDGDEQGVHDPPHATVPCRGAAHDGPAAQRRPARRGPGQPREAAAMTHAVA